MSRNHCPACGKVHPTEDETGEYPGSLAASRDCAQPFVLAFCGPAGSGKSTAARMLAARYRVEILPMAAPLKAMLAALGVPERNLMGSPTDKTESLDILGGKSARYAMQTLGTEWGRQSFGDGFWVEAWKRRVLASSAWAIVCDDVRFESEAAAIHAMGGRLVCIVRSDADFDVVPEHKSEAFGSLNFDAIVKNDGTLGSLKRDVHAALDMARMLPSRERIRA